MAKKPTLADLRDAARAVVHETPTDQPLRWRVVTIEYGGGIAPVCAATQYTAGNTTWATHDLPYGGGRDDLGLYDCCPEPHIEVWSDAMAAYLVALLNADADADAARPPKATITINPDPPAVAEAIREVRRAGGLPRRGSEAGRG